jgi:septal ring factor EnvC (AmiA/AmiB activator)
VNTRFGSGLVGVVLVACGLGAYSVSAQEPTGSFDPRSALLEARVEEQGILGQLATIDAQLQQVMSDTLELRQQLEELEMQRASHSAAVQDADQQLNDLEGGVQAQIRALYRIQRQGLAQLLFGADDPQELRRRSRYLLHMVQADAGRLEEFEKIRDERKATLAQLDADRGKLDQLRADLEIKETELREQRAARMDLLQQIRERRELNLQALAEMDRARDQFDAMLDARSLPSSVATQTVGMGTGGAGTAGAGVASNDAWAGGMGISRSAVPTAPSSANSFRESFGRLPWPVRGRLVRRYGLSNDPVTGQQTSNNGIDVAAEFAEPVRAVYRGIVRMAGPIRGLGQTVAIQHGDYTTVYAHLSGVRVRVDDTVVAGQVIGLVGNTGLTAADGYRLTFEVRYNNSPQDPLPWLVR